MMKFLFGLLLLMPLVNNFWLVQWVLFFLTYIYMFKYSYVMFENISYFLGSDLLSFSLILLSFWICSLMILSSSKILKLKNYFQFFLFIIIILMISLYLTFSSMNLFIFYMFFEVSLIPTLILIIGWGYQPERLEAGIYLFFYTLLMSLPMMVMIFYIYYNYKTLSFQFMKMNFHSLFMYLLINLGCFKKIMINLKEIKSNNSMSDISF